MPRGRTPHRHAVDAAAGDATVAGAAAAACRQIAQLLRRASGVRCLQLLAQGVGLLSDFLAIETPQPLPSAPPPEAAPAAAVPGCWVLRDAAARRPRRNTLQCLLNPTANLHAHGAASCRTLLRLPCVAASRAPRAAPHAPGCLSSRSSLISRRMRVASDTCSNTLLIFLIATCARARRHRHRMLAAATPQCAPHATR